jgi:large subunit ribosomal protein L33
MAKKNTITVILECIESRDSEVPGVSRYAIKRNKKKHRNRIELMKYNPYLRKHTLHREIKKS